MASKAERPAELHERLAKVTATIAKAHPKAEVLEPLSHIGISDLAQDRYDQRRRINRRAEYSDDRSVPQPSGVSFSDQAHQFGNAVGRESRVRDVADTLDKILGAATNALPDNNGQWLPTMIVLGARNMIKVRTTSGTELAATLAPLVDQLADPEQTRQPNNPFPGGAPLGEDADALLASCEEGYADGWRTTPEGVTKVVSELRAAFDEDGLNVKDLVARVRQIVNPLARETQSLSRERDSARQEAGQAFGRLVTDTHIHDANVLDDAIVVRVEAVNVYVGATPLAAEAEELWKVVQGVGTKRDGTMYLDAGWVTGDNVDENVELGAVDGAERAAMLERILEYRAENNIEGPHLFGDRPVEDVLADGLSIPKIAEIIHTDERYLQEAVDASHNGPAVVADRLVQSTDPGLIQ